MSVLEKEKEAVENNLVNKAEEIMHKFTPHIEKELFLHKRDRSGNHPTDLGDYDVLSYYPDKNIIFNIECKDILPVYCIKDARRLRNKIFSEKDGYHNKMLKRQEYIENNVINICKMLKWAIKENNPPIVLPIFISRRTYWWTKYPPIETDIKFLRIDFLSNYIENI